MILYGVEECGPNRRGSGKAGGGEELVQVVGEAKAEGNRRGRREVGRGDRPEWQGKWWRREDVCTLK